MDEQIVKERLEETISYNVSNEKKWYVRAIPLFIKHLAMELIFLRTSRAHTMTFSNNGPAKIREDLREDVEDFELLVGASPKQRMKCGAVAYDGKLAWRLRVQWQRIVCRKCFSVSWKIRGSRWSRRATGSQTGNMIKDGIR